MDVRRERVVQEIEKKAEKISLRWFEKNYEKVFKNPQLNPDQIPKNAAKLYEEIVQSRKRLIQWTKENEEKIRQEKKKGKKKEEIRKYTEEELTWGPMYPVPEEVKKVLYSGVSHNSEGRYAYLRLRYDESPDLRYRDSPTWGWDLGWEVRKRAWPPLKCHAKSAIVQSSFYRRTGAMGTAEDLERKQPFSSAHVAVEIL